MGPVGHQLESSSALAPRLASALLGGLGSSPDAGYYASFQIVYERPPPPPPDPATTKFQRVEDPATSKFERVEPVDPVEQWRTLPFSTAYVRIEIADLVAEPAPAAEPDASDTIQMASPHVPRVVLYVSLFLAAFALGVGVPFLVM